MTEAQLYERDFYAWTNEQASLLRSGKLSEADIENIAEEIESMGKTEKRELASRLVILLLHLLKWQYQPEKRCNSWRNTIRVQRFDLADHINENPSLKSIVSDSVEKYYGKAVIEASSETGLSESIFPATCLWSFDEICSNEFWPG